MKTTLLTAALFASTAMLTPAFARHGNYDPSYYQQQAGLFAHDLEVCQSSQDYATCAGVAETNDYLRTIQDNMTSGEQYGIDPLAPVYTCAPNCTLK